MIDCEKEFLKELRMEAQSGAEKICGIGTCTCPSKCSHVNHDADASLNYGGRLRIPNPCPLAEYNVEPDTRNWTERNYEESNPTEDEIFALCVLYPYSDAEQDDERWSVHRKDLELCISRPVKMAEECMQECWEESLS